MKGFNAQRKNISVFTVPLMIITNGIVIISILLLTIKKTIILSLEDGPRKKETNKPRDETFEPAKES